MSIHGTTTTLHSKFRSSKAMKLSRQQILKRAGGRLYEAVRSIQHSVIMIPANQIIMRFVPENATHLKNYADVFRLPPDLKLDGERKSLGGYSDSNRFTGIIDDCHLGLNGSYWGTADGVAGEHIFYSMWGKYEGETPQLIAKYGHVIVQRAAGVLNHWEDQDVPKQLIFSGSMCTNIIVARTIRPIRCLNLNLSDPLVHTQLKQNQHKFEPLLSELEFGSLEEAIEDSEFREFARQYVHGACSTITVEGIWVRTVRHELGQHIKDFNKDAAQNLILLGLANGTLTDRLVGRGVIKIRSDSNGLNVTAVPIMGKQSPYDDGQIQALTVVKL